MDSEIEGKSNSYWSQRAEEYSALHMDTYRSDRADRFRSLLTEVAAGAPCAGARRKALDLGCGSGFLSLLLCEAGCEVTGVDFSEQMLDQARANAQGEGFDDATFLHMRAQELTLPDESFDLVVSRNVTWVLQDVDRVYEHVLRVLVPGGVFLNMDANYGKAFNESDAQGVTPSHPTQSLEQLRIRNEVARGLDITYVDRPVWDAAQFWSLGATRVECRRFGMAGQVGSDNDMFALIVVK